MTTILRSPDIDLEDMNRRELALPEGAPLSGVLRVANKTLVNLPEEGIAAGFWNAETGRARFDFIESGEVVYVIEGEVDVHEDGGETVTLRPGTAAAFPKGWTGEWEIRGPFRKFTAIYT